MSAAFAFACAEVTKLMSPVCQNRRVTRDTLRWPTYVRITPAKSANRTKDMDMLVYRVAHSVILDPNTGSRHPLGPYRARSEPRLDAEIRNALNEMSWEHSDDAHPTPEQDGITFTMSHLCAFTDTATLRKWFHGYLDLLNRGQFRVFVYDVPKRAVRMGDIQLIFDPRDAALRGSWAIRTKVPPMRAKWARCPT